MLEIIPFSKCRNKKGFFSELHLLDNIVLATSGSLYDNESWTEQQFRFNLPKKDTLSFVCFHSKSIIGFSVGYSFLPNWCHISRLALHPDFRGRGIAKNILQVQINEMVKQLPDAITVDTQKNNYAAIKLYNSYNFKILTGLELEAYIKIRDRKAAEYISNNASHHALLNRLNEQFKLEII
ncbi:MAG: GNAT family N-acetyltransferase [Chitinophagaceae bacterium]